MYFENNIRIYIILNMAYSVRKIQQDAISKTKMRNAKTRNKKPESGNINRKSYDSRQGIRMELKILY